MSDHLFSWSVVFKKEDGEAEQQQRHLRMAGIISKRLAAWNGPVSGLSGCRVPAYEPLLSQPQKPEHGKQNSFHERAHFIWIQLREYERGLEW